MKQFSLEVLASTLLNKRRQDNLSQQDIADRTGINRSVISRIEQVEHTPSLAQLELLAQALACDVTDFYVE